MRMKVHGVNLFCALNWVRHYIFIINQLTEYGAILPALHQSTHTHKHIHAHAHKDTQTHVNTHIDT